jgi:hypothetical protein
MTRRDFIALARALSEAKPGKDADPVAHFAWRNTAQIVTLGLVRHCPNFDDAKFRAACGLD